MPAPGRTRMFDRFIRLAKARQALREDRFEDALQLAADPLIQSDRRAEQVRVEAQQRLLARAQQRLAAGDAVAAKRDYQRLRELGCAGGLEALAAGLEQAAAAGKAAFELARTALAEARRLLGTGDTAGAGAVLATLPTREGLPELHQLTQLVGERRRLANEQLASIPALLQGGQIAVAVERFAHAFALARDVAEAFVGRAELQRMAVAEAVRRIGTRLAEADLESALAHYRQVRGETPWLAAAEGLRGIERELQQAVLAFLRHVADCERAVAMARAVQAAGLPLQEPLVPLLECLLRSAAGASAAGGAMVALREAALAAGAEGLAAAAGSQLRRDQEHHDQVTAARGRLAAGELDQARELLTRVLVEQPLHEAARADLHLVERGLAEVEQRLEVARSAAREGRLREACAGALALVGSGRIGQEAHLLVADLRSRMALVDRGLDEVRVALHGRSAASVEGVRHCLGRLEELAKFQTDHQELQRVTAAVSAEIEALQLLDQVGLAAGREDLAKVIALLGQIRGMRDRLLVQDRLDARLLHWLDRVQQLADLALVAGRLADVETCAGLLGTFAAVRGEFADREAALRRACAQRRATADALVEQARAQLAAADLAEAERLVEQALLQCNDSAAARALSDQLRDLRRQSEALARVESMARERDFHGARRQLAELPPTPALLRTRIYDMKQNLARAQGLEGAFLLRIDEGGEHLVVRGESVSIGNVRQTRSDLPVLANIAGRHATIRRSMSFHGGMQDTVVADEGEVRIGGKLVTSQRLQPGDRMQLGPSLQLVYSQPTSRSLSVSLQLQGGFQVGGTDRVVLMKDRGRDGRLLIGPGRDVHARVASATGEVEVFATNTGQIRVACDAGGSIDGVPFRGDHPVAAGQLVQAAGVTFVLLPWHPGA